MYSWGLGESCRLGLGFIKHEQSTPNQLTPYQLENVFDNNRVVTAGCGDKMSGVAMQSGTVYTWGKGDHEKPKYDDFMEFSTPYVILEEKSIVHLAFGKTHVVALDQNGAIYAWGDGSQGCLGLGDGKKRNVPQLLTFFADKHVIDVSCGEKFTVVIAEVKLTPKQLKAAAKASINQD